jgi:hypothetical protein
MSAVIYKALDVESIVKILDTEASGIEGVGYSRLRMQG